MLSQRISSLRRKVYTAYLLANARVLIYRLVTSLVGRAVLKYLTLIDVVFTMLPAYSISKPCWE
jgi:hypothetical protein